MKRSVRRALAAAVLVTAGLGSAAAAEPTTEQLFRDGTTALTRGGFDEAVDYFELLSDRGFVHPDASFNRAAAYVGRAGSSAARPGDWGRAAAALEEVLRLRPDDAEARGALTRLRAEISRRRSRSGADPVVARPALLRAVVGVVSERVYAILALLGSALLTAGVALRVGSRAERVRLTAAIGCGVGALLLVLGGGLAALARHLRVSAEPAVVVVSEARLMDETGTPVSPKQVEHVAVPEGASVFVRERRGRLALVEWGTTRGWVTLGDLRFLADP